MRYAHLPATVLLALSALSVQANTQATLTVGSLSATVSDLDANDGVAASLSWSSPAFMSTASWGSQQTGWTKTAHVNYDEYLPVFAARQQWNAFAGTGDTSLSTSLGGGQQTVSSLGAGLSSMQLNHSVNSGADFTSYATSSQQFTLAAHSAVRFDIEYGGSLSSDPFGGHLSLPGAFSVLSFSALSYNVALIVDGQHTWGTDTASGSWWDTKPVAQHAAHQHISYTVQNNSDVAATYHLSVMGYVQALQLTAPVPEPGTYALMLLGLAGLGLIGQKRRRP